MENVYINRDKKGQMSHSNIFSPNSKTSENKIDDQLKKKISIKKVTCKELFLFISYIVITAIILEKQLSIKEAYSQNFSLDSNYFNYVQRDIKKFYDSTKAVNDSIGSIIEKIYDSNGEQKKLGKELIYIKERKHVVPISNLRITQLRKPFINKLNSTTWKRNEYITDPFFGVNKSFKFNSKKSFFFKKINFSNFSFLLLLN